MKRTVDVNKEKMKQISYSRYNNNYYKECYGSSKNFSSLLKKNDFKPRYQEICELLVLEEKDIIVDYGCGNGDLSFFISKNYNSQVLGIDYSSDAIVICEKKLKVFSKIYPNAKIRFSNLNNDCLPELSNVKAVFLSDVVEHMYDHEIEMVLKHIISWNKKELFILIRTDNDIYEKFIRPFVYAIQLILFLQSIKSIKEMVTDNKKVEQDQHINLTNPIKLRRKLKKFGFSQVSISYPKITNEKIIGQLNLGVGFPHIFIKSIAFILNIFIFLSPSFYGMYKTSSKK